MAQEMDTDVPVGWAAVPGNGAKNIGTSPILSWTKGQSSTSYIVHFGTDITSPYSYTWSGVANGTYSITAVATDKFGAITASVAVNITVLNVTGILSENCGQEVKIYQLPVNNLLNIELESVPEKEVNICLTDLSGKVLRSVKANSISQTLDMSGLPSGFYLIKFTGKNINVIRQVLKQ